MPSGATQLIKSKLLFASAKVSAFDVLQEFKKVVQKLLSTHFKIVFSINILCVIEVYKYPKGFNICYEEKIPIEKCVSFV